jgi:hypothetical protein
MSAGMPSCFSLGEGQIFVARRNPELREKTSPDIYLERGAALETPIGGWQLQPANSTAGNGQEFAGLRSSTVTIPTRKSGSQETRRWREKDSNLYGAFPVKGVVLVLLRVLCSERDKPFFVL